MSQYDNTNRGAAWKNDDRQSDTHPHFKGSINVDGKEYWLNCWYNKPEEGSKKPTFSYSVAPKQPTSAPAPKPAAMDFDNDVPFSNYEYKTLA